VRVFVCAVEHSDGRDPFLAPALIDSIDFD
jgi:hypothetical protein